MLIWHNSGEKKKLSKKILLINKGFYPLTEMQFSSQGHRTHCRSLADRTQLIAQRRERQRERCEGCNTALDGCSATWAAARPGLLPSLSLLRRAKGFLSCSGGSVALTDLMDEV